MSARRIYVASSWRNEVQPDVVRQLEAAGHDVYDFRNPRFGGGKGFAWSDVDPAWRDWTPEAYREALGHPIAQHGLGADLAGLEWADTCVMVQPCGRSAALELGYMLGQGKRGYVLLAPGQEPELMLGLAHGLCTTMRELIEALRVLGPTLCSRRNP